MRALAGVSGGRKPFSRNRPRKEVLADYLSFQAAPGVPAGAWKKEEDPSRAGSGLGSLLSLSSYNDYRQRISQYQHYQGDSLC
jgi:hypothetical protein